MKAMFCALFAVPLPAGPFGHQIRGRMPGLEAARMPLEKRVAEFT